MPRGCEKASRLSLSLTCGRGTGSNCLAVAASCCGLRERVGPTGSRWVDTGAEACTSHKILVRAYEKMQHRADDDEDEGSAKRERERYRWPRHTVHLQRNGCFIF
uniref:Uncharacterized protein n=1 Tax=Oryza nivara TaxID=4536 RepID=A0A0E0IYL1_ORYNI